MTGLIFVVSEFLPGASFLGCPVQKCSQFVLHKFFIPNKFERFSDDWRKYRIKHIGYARFTRAYSQGEAAGGVN